MNCIRADLCGTTTSVWDSALGLELSRAKSGKLGSAMTGCVLIDGDWHGAVALQCQITLARKIAVSLFGLDQFPESESVSEALGEITSRIAFDLNAALPFDCEISSPAVAIDSKYMLGVVGATEIESIAFNCEGEFFLVTLMEREPSREMVTA